MHAQRLRSIVSWLLGQMSFEERQLDEEWQRARDDGKASREKTRRIMVGIDQARTDIRGTVDRLVELSAAVGDDDVALRPPRDPHDSAASARE